MSANNILLVLPGWTSSKEKQIDLTAHIVEATGTSALVIDYSGHGQSPLNAMEIRPAQHFLEIITAFDWIRQSYPNATISVLGTSYGGYMAALLTEHRDVKNLILRVPAIYAIQDFYTLNKDIDRQNERLYRQNPTFLNAHPLFKNAPGFEGRAFVMWHELDEYVPKATTDKYIEAFKADSHFTKGWKHSFNLDAPPEEQLQYKNAISDWLNKTT